MTFLILAAGPMHGCVQRAVHSCMFSLPDGYSFHGWTFNVDESEDDDAFVVAVHAGTEGLGRFDVAREAFKIAVEAGALDQWIFLKMSLRHEQAGVDTQLKNAEMMIEQVKFLLSQVAEIQRAKAQISSQLAASTMSAVNYGASVSSSMGNSRTCSTNFSFSGETMDA